MCSTAITLENEQVLVARAVAEPADDITAQVFERALARIGSYRPKRGPFAAWLFAIARNAIRDHLRAANRRRWLSLDTVTHWASAGPQPEEIVARNETWDELLDAVACLSERDRDIVALKFGGRLTNRRIAELTGLRERHVSVILFRALRRLRSALDEREEGHGRK